MKNIIIYATKYGSVAEASKRIKAELDGETELFNIMTGRVPPLDIYNTVILGGSVYIGRVQKQLKNYIDSHLEHLLGKNIGIFLCAGAQSDEEQTKQFQTNFPEAILEHAAAKEVLGYSYSFEKMGFFEKLVVSKIKGNSISTSEFFDDRIARFAKALNNNSIV